MDDHGFIHVLIEKLYYLDRIQEIVLVSCSRDTSKGYVVTKKYFDP